MEPESDPRIYFAAERTLLAWLRTGLAVIGLGFLVARFGVFLMIMREQMVERNQLASSLIGIAFVLLGTFMIAASTWQHQQFSKRLDIRSKPGHYSTAFSVWVCTLLSISGLVLAIYLAISVAVTE